jgi:predicted phosphodiesterase
MLSALHDHSLNIKFKNLIKNHENAMVYVHAGNNRCITIDSE